VVGRDDFRLLGVLAWRFLRGFVRCCGSPTRVESGRVATSASLLVVSGRDDTWPPS